MERVVQMKGAEQSAACVQRKMEQQDPFQACMRKFLPRFGITPNYIGYFYLIDALKLTVEEPQRLLLVTKLVYPEVACRHRTTAQAVERSLRTVAETAWRTNQELLQMLVGHPLSRRLNVSSLLAVLSLEIRF
ncbi:MAG: sporulation initiation factor Spo0A C-terminal domain-containing protein [Lachnospiraceae bacterium]|nr:sporulation initiation factor Spo0A C-terminal domain-containing protein [Lachnospiraceae bacterium]